MDRRCIGVELKPELAAYVREKLPDGALENQVQVLEGDSTRVETAERVRQALQAWGQTHAQLVVLHPPYHDIIQFSEHPEDLSNAPDTEDFLEGFAAVARNAYALLDEGRFACLIIGDKYAQRRADPPRVPVHAENERRRLSDQGDRGQGHPGQRTRPKGATGTCGATAPWPAAFTCSSTST